MALCQWCGIRSQNATQAQVADDIQEHRPTGCFKRQRMLASTISAHSRVLRDGNEVAVAEIVGGCAAKGGLRRIQNLFIRQLKVDSTFCYD